MLTEQTNTTSRWIMTESTRGADKSLARPGRKQATATEDFDFHTHTHTTGPNFTLPNTDYAHKTSQVISVKHV